jgi:hypothetical protein
MVTSRRGVSKLGCLVSLLLAVTVAYFGVNVGEVYLRYYRFHDAMVQEARFARTNNDDAIRLRLAALADSLGLPEEATHVQVRRTAQSITIFADYDERVELPWYVRQIRFVPRADAPL